MCLIAVAWGVSARYPLALVANRDESHARPSAPAGYDPDRHDVFGGRDLVQGGSWLMVSTRGRLAAVTNVRVGRNPEVAPLSRGSLVRRFVSESVSAQDYVASLASEAPGYGRFNLLVWDGSSLAFASNHPEFASRLVPPGVHAMSNGAFDARWPKGMRATQALASWLESSPEQSPDTTLLFEALADTQPAPDDELPDTGVGLDLERLLSPPFIRAENYGTRCSTIVLVGAGEVSFFERRFGPNAEPAGETAALLTLTSR